MCGIVALLLANEDSWVNQLLFDGLTVLQHRGQDAAGMVTAERMRLHLRKDNGLVRDVFQQQHMTELRGNIGLGHVRYPTAGSSSCAEAQPLYTNYPHGICVAHNGNLTNTDELYKQMIKKQRHVNTDSDSEILLNYFAESLNKHQRISIDDVDKEKATVDAVFDTCTDVMKQCRGGYATVYLINGVGLVGFRDPNGIRPLVVGCRSKDPEDRSKKITAEFIEQQSCVKRFDYCMASESVAIDALGFQLVRDIGAGEAFFVDMNTGKCHFRQCQNVTTSAPCIFEYVYFARPDSIMDGVSVYESRLKMGEKLADKVKRIHPNHDIDVVIPIPETARTCALQTAHFLDIPFREGFVKNRYIARTFIMPGQAKRKKSVRLKLNTIKREFADKNVLLVDDSIVRGTTANEIVQMAREAGAKKVYFCSAAPPIRYPNIYGIDIPTRKELIAYEREEEEISAKIGCDWVMYQDLDDLESSVIDAASPGHSLTKFDTSCFSGIYVTGEKIGDEYFQRLYNLRNDAAKQKRNENGVGNLGTSTNKPQQSNNGCESVQNDNRKNSLVNSNSCEAILNA
jgi:amidophosphoribosyltransferase